MRQTRDIRLTEEELEAVKEVLSRSIRGPDTDTHLGCAYDKVLAALWVIADERREDEA